MWIYIVLLLLLGLTFMFFEMFVPGGILGVIGIAMMGAGVWLSFSHYGNTEGVAVFLVCFVTTVSLIAVFINRFPHTYFGKRMILSSGVAKSEGFHAESFATLDLPGKEGVTESALRPSGIALIEGERYDVVTEGEYVPAQTRIKVIRVDGNRIVVGRD